MPVSGVGVSFPRDSLMDLTGVEEQLGSLKRIGTDFVELCPQRLGAVSGGALDRRRTSEVLGILRALEESEPFVLGYTVHPPLRLNLMDPESAGLQRGILEASLRFASEVGASAVVCHAGIRDNIRHTRWSLKQLMEAERHRLREAGELAYSLGVTIAVENLPPTPAVIRGEQYSYSSWPTELAAQIEEVDHPAIGVCLDTGHAGLSAGFYGMDFVQACHSLDPFISHVHLHDNFGRPDPAGEPEPSEKLAYGLGDLHLPPSHGTLTLEELSRTLELAREPACCVELNPNTPPDVIEEALARSRALFPSRR